jgi:hypothetical protein
MLGNTKCVVFLKKPLQGTYKIMGVNVLKCTDVSRTISVPIIRVLGGDWRQDVLWASIYTGAQANRDDGDGDCPRNIGAF